MKSVDRLEEKRLRLAAELEVTERQLVSTKAAAGAITRQCSKCLKVKPASAYYRKDGNIDGRLGSCIECHCADMRARYVPKPKTPRPPALRAVGEHGGRELAAVDLTPCPRCSLRGHEEGDPDRCLQPLPSTGLGCQGWV